MTILLRTGEGRELSVWAPKRANSGGSVDAAQAASLASLLEREVLPRMKPGERMLLDGTLWRGHLDWKSYSLKREARVGVSEGAGCVCLRRFGPVTSPTTQSTPSPARRPSHRSR